MVSPSSNSYTSINPSIRVYELDKTTHELLDYEQYYMDLEAADMDGKRSRHLSFYNAFSIFATVDNLASECSKSEY